MALKINCLLNNPSAIPQLTTLVEKIAHSLNSKKRSAKVDDVYREIRDMGVEVDAESVAFAYKSVSGIMNRKNFSTQAEVNAFGGEAMKSAIEIANRGGLKNSKLGKMSASRSVASGLATTFSTLEGNNNVYKSRLVELKDLMTRVANSMIDKSGYTAAPRATFEEILKSALDAEDIGKTGTQAVNGKIKGNFATIEDMWNEMKDDITAISKGIKDKAARARFDQMVSAIQSSSYNLLLGTKQADDVIKGIMKEAGYTKEVNGPNGKVQVIDWNKALSNQKDWKDEFGLVLRRSGFTISQTQRIIAKLDGNYNQALAKQAENKLNEIRKKNNISGKVNRDAVDRLVKLKNAGLFSPANRSTLDEAMGFGVPQDIADKASEILSDYEANIGKYGNISNVYAEEVQTKLKLLLSPLGKSGIENIIQNMSDYFALKASSTISSIFNTIQNMTSGIGASFMPSITAIASSKNPKLIGFFLDSWANTLMDVSKGGVSPRDAKTVNLNQFENRGGLSDRWTFDNSKSAFGYLKATMNILGQVTATAMDAANGTVIYNAEMVKSVKQVLKAKGLTGAEANKAIDDAIFGQHSSGVSNRSFWNGEARKMLDNQTDVISRSSKAQRISSELLWSDLVTKYGLTIDQIKAMQSASLGQMSKDLGHQSDIILSPASALTWASSKMSENAEEARKKGDAGTHATWTVANTIFKAVNMFIGGKVNWAILALENTPVGVAVALTDIAMAEAFNKKGNIPFYRQNLDLNDSEQLKAQLAIRKGIVGRLERGIIGTATQGMLYAGFMAMMHGGSSDDERKRLVRKKFDKYMRDPATRRLMDKVAPMTLASELAFAYNKKTNTLDEKKISNSLMLPYYLHPNKPFAFYEYYKANLVSNTGLDYLLKSYEQNNRIGKEEARNEANAESTMQYVGGLVSLPYTALWNTAKTEVKLIENHFEPDMNANAARKAKFRNQAKNIDGWAEAFMNGIITPDIYQGVFKNKK